jgi:hypothetical protein
MSSPNIDSDDSDFDDLPDVEDCYASWSVHWLTNVNPILPLRLPLPLVPTLHLEPTPSVPLNRTASTSTSSTATSSTTGADFR